MAKIHIMMATYNGEKYIREQIDSILAQTYTDWKLFISDDCSTDGTLDIIEQYCGSYPDKICILNKTKKMGGANKNFSYLFSECPEAEYYMFSDQDDIWLPEKIERMLQVLHHSNVEKECYLVHCDLKVVDANLHTIKESFYSQNRFRGMSYLLMNNYIPGCTMLYNHATREKIGKIPDACVMHDWWIVLYVAIFGQIIFCEQTLNLYRQHENNVIGAGVKTQKQRDKSRNRWSALMCQSRDKFNYLCSKYNHLLTENIAQADAFYKRYGRQMDPKIRFYFGAFTHLFEKRIRGVFHYWRYFRYGYLGRDLYCTLCILGLTRKEDGQ